MFKKSIIIIILLFVIIGIQVSSVIAAVTDNSFFYTNKQEISQGETLEMTLDILKVQYDKFEFKLSSNLDTSNIVVNENVETKKYNNEININIDKENINLDKITFYYQVPENAQVGTKIEVIAQIIVEEESGNEQNNIDENTITEEIQKNDVENKKIEVSIVEKKQQNNQVKPNEQQNNQIKLNEQETTSTFEKTEKQESDFLTNQVKNENEETETAVYNGSNNNYLSSLEIEGETLNTTFNKENTTYFVKTTGKTELNINVTKEDDNAKVYITGNTNLKEGDNKILISVIAENGDVRYYRIFVT